MTSIDELKETQSAREAEAKIFLLRFGDTGSDLKGKSIEAR